MRIEQVLQEDDQLSLARKKGTFVAPKYSLLTTADKTNNQLFQII